VSGDQSCIIAAELSRFTRQGKVWIVRWVHLLLAWLIVLGQFHLCEPTYQFRDGRTCFTCPDLADAPTELADSVVHNDCHDCCEIRACDDESPQDLALATSFSADVVLAIPPVFEFLIPTRPIKFSVPVYQESAPPTGPPGICASRAPPSRLFPLPSAGSKCASVT
jgi:hypothetical protein